MKLEVGKSYINSAGEVREIIGKEDEVYGPLFVDERGFIYKGDGLCNVAPSSLYSPLVYSHLVEEVGAEEVKAEEPTPEEVKEPTLLVPKGRALQYRTSKDSEWEDIHTCTVDFEYRVKPNRETVVRYANVHSDGDAGSSRKVSISPKWEAQTRIAVLKITTTFDGDKPNLPTVEVISHEDALKLEASK